MFGVLILVLIQTAGPAAVIPSPLDSQMQAQARAYEMTRPSPGIHFSPRAAAAYAMGSGCVPAIVTGRPAQMFFQPAATRSRPDAQGRYTVSTAVTLQQGPRGDCTVVSDRGDPEDLRAAVLKALDDAGALRRVAQDSGAGSQDSNGSFRQELHCLTVDGKPMFLVMSTSSARNRRPLMASLGADETGECRARLAD